jgi:asparagine synthase (glutamine-hydrolysing)
MRPFACIFGAAANSAGESQKRALVKFLSALGWREASSTNMAEVYLTQSAGRHQSNARSAPSQRLSIAFDGWLENYDELLNTLRLGQGEDAVSDADVVVAAYERWGNDAPQHLYGEYAVTIWNTATKELLAFRDRTGIRPLYVSTLPNASVAFATLPGALTLLNDVGNVFNEGAVAEYLNGREVSGNDTMYKNVYRFPGGHQMIWRPGMSVLPARYWRPSSQRFLRTDEELIDEFGSLLKKVTRAASRSADAVCCEVSGGVDSSSVATVLGTLSAADCLLCPRVEGHSVVYPGFACDESAYIEEVRKKIPFDLHTHTWSLPTLNELEDAIKRLRYPYRPFGLWGKDKSVVAHGGNVVLTGHGGDELFNPTEIALRQALFTASTFRAVAARVADRWLSATHTRSFYGRAYVAAVELAGWRLKRLGHWYVQRTERRPPEINEQWFQAVGWSRRTTPSTVPSYARVANCEIAASGYLGAAMEWLSMHGALCGLEYRHPLCSASLMEFANRLPTQLLDGFSPFTRWPMRKALRGTLPEAIAVRCDKAEFTESSLHGLWPLWDERLGNADITREEKGGETTGWRYYMDFNAQHCWPPLAALSINQWFEQGLTSHPMGLPALQVLR